MTMRISPAVLTFLALSLSASSPGAPAAVPAQTLDLTPVVLRGNVHPAIAAGKVLGTVSRATPMEKMILALKLSPEAEQRRETLMKSQLDPKSAGYHKWLTPQQYGQQFGPSAADLDKVTGWLRSQGFRIDQVTNGRGSVVFSGTAGLVMDAFRTTIASVDVKGVRHMGNVTDPSIPQGLTSLVHGVVSLHDIPLKAMNSGGKLLGPAPAGNAQWDKRLYDGGNGHSYLAPEDFWTIYNTLPAFNAQNYGQGMSIAIVGRTDILRSDVESFRTFFGLPPNKLAITYNGPNPGINGDEGESDLDVEWAGAAAPGATVEFVTTASTTVSDGVLVSLLYVIDTNLAPVASMSYGSGEVLNGSAFSAWISTTFAQAAAQGQTWFVSAGDAGSAGGDTGSDQGDYGGLQTNSLGSSADNVCVGGTQFDETQGAGPYWDANGKALTWIPEVVWNQSYYYGGGSGDWATGGGFSAYVPQPWWQQGVVPNPKVDPVTQTPLRAVPDVALTASQHDGYLVTQEGLLYSFGGTSCSSPAFAGLMALVVQATGQKQGNANPVLYQLGANQYLSDGPKVFNDITMGTNAVDPMDDGSYLAAPGYDPCTGLGSVDASALVANWIMGAANTVTASITAPAEPVAFITGGTQTFTAAGTDSNPQEILTYLWNFGDGALATGPTVTHTFAATPGIATSNYPVVLTVFDSTGNLAGTSVNVRVTSPDLNGDGGKSLLDLLQWSIDMTTGNLEGDLNSDGLVNDADLTILLGAL